MLSISPIPNPTAINERRHPDLEPEDEWHGEVFVQAHTALYSGRSSAWFNWSQLQDFTAVLKEYPMDKLRPPSLAGGEYTMEGALKYAHVGVGLSPWNATGTLLVRVELRAHELYFPDGTPWQQAIVHFLTDYAALDTFRHELADLKNGGKAKLVGSER